MELADNQLEITVEGGLKEVINVLDIIESYAFKKTFILYTFQNEPDNIYASILNEQETTFSFDTITNPEEIEYITNEIDRFVNEEEQLETM